MIDLRFTKDEIPSMENFNKRFEKLNGLSNFLGNEYVWAKIRTEQVPSYTEVTYSTSNSNTNIVQTNAVGVWPVSLYYADGFSVNSSKQFVLENPSVLSVDAAQASTVSIYDALKGKYVIKSKNADSKMYYYPADATFTETSFIIHGLPCNYYTNPKIVTEVESYGYVNSPNPNAYPPAVNDGYTYIPYGQLANSVRLINSGSYVGTGTYGSSNPTVINFDTEPDMVVVFAKGAGFSFFIQENTRSISSYWGNGAPGYHCYILEFGTTLKFYANSSGGSAYSPAEQLNGQYQNYYWFAFRL